MLILSLLFIGRQVFLKAVSSLAVSVPRQTQKTYISETVSDKSGIGLELQSFGLIQYWFHLQTRRPQKKKKSKCQSMHQAKGELKLLKWPIAKPIQLLGLHPKKELCILNSVVFLGGTTGYSSQGQWGRSLYNDGRSKRCILATLVAYLTGQRKEIAIAMPSLPTASAVDTPDTEGFLASFFFKPSFIFLALQQSRPKINHISTTSIGPTKPDYGTGYLCARSFESCSVITAS